MNKGDITGLRALVLLGLMACSTAGAAFNLADMWWTHAHCAQIVLPGLGPALICESKAPWWP